MFCLCLFVFTLLIIGDLFSGPDSKESACNAGDPGSILGLGRFPWRRERLPTPVYWPGEFYVWGASVRNSAHGKGHEEGGLAYAKA